MIILRIIQIFVVWLVIASLVGVAVRRFRLPYTVVLVLVGLALAIITPIIRNHPQMVSPEAIRTLLIPNLILSVFIPPLVFEAAFQMELKALHQDLGKVLAFAVPGVVITMLLVGFGIAWMPGLTVPVALLFGALISATDPVSVIALFRSLGAPKRLLLLLEGESLFNDGTAIVLFHLMLGVVSAAGSVSVLGSLINFVKVATGGLIIGWGVGSLSSFFIKRVKDDYIEISLSIIAAYGSYLLAESFHLSGVLAVVAAGLTCGMSGSRAVSEATRERLDRFWEYAAYLANTFLFLLIGLTINLGTVIREAIYSIMAIVAVLVARAVVIYAFSRLFKNIPLEFQHVLFWGGLRGAVSLALALSLTSEELGANLGLLQAMAFSVVLFTLLVQGTSMSPLLAKLRLTGVSASGEIPATQ
jgi:CPA1 family monovalent cation:H+ antiporter